MTNQDNITRHGGPWDRGSMDAYYQRPFQPHYFKGETHNSERVERSQMSKEEIAAYAEGYEEQGDMKEW